MRLGASVAEQEPLAFFDDGEVRVRVAASMMPAAAAPKVALAIGANRLV
jgi:hypothetical protein